MLCLVKDAVAEVKMVSIKFYDNWSRPTRNEVDACRGNNRVWMRVTQGEVKTDGFL